jgi:hypothetical protein
MFKTFGVEKPWMEQPVLVRQLRLTSTGAGDDFLRVLEAMMVGAFHGIRGLSKRVGDDVEELAVVRVQVDRALSVLEDVDFALHSVRRKFEFEAGDR